MADRTIQRHSEIPHPSGADGVIRIRGAKVHNLRGVDLDLPRDRLTVITGVSGSGKSSLAFDTLYAEGQRQYIESLSTYARQFLDQLQRPDVDWVDGLEPTLCIDQKRGTNNPRSTVATVTEIYDYLRLMYARIGVPHCYNCGTAILQQSADTIVDSLSKLPESTKLMLLAPMVRGRRGKHDEIFQEIRKAGFVRVRVDGETHVSELLGLALPDVPRVIRSIAALDEPRHDVRPGGVDQQLQLVETGVHRLLGGTRQLYADDHDLLPDGPVDQRGAEGFLVRSVQLVTSISIVATWTAGPVSVTHPGSGESSSTVALPPSMCTTSFPSTGVASPHRAAA